MSLEKKLKDKNSELIYLQQEIDYLKRKLYDNQQELESTTQQKNEYEKNLSFANDNEMVKKIVNESRQELIHEVYELKDAMAKLLEEKKRLTDDLS